MITELGKATNEDLVTQLLSGHCFVFHDFTNKQLYYDSVKRKILDGIEEFEGAGCRAAVEKAGLANMHEYFPADKLIYLDMFIRNHLRRLLIEMTYAFCKAELKWPTEFFIAPDTFVVKIAYPFDVAIKSKVSYADYVAYATEMSTEWQPFTVGNLLKKAKSSARKLLHRARPSAGYHDHYPYAANAYGAHLDSWYGAPLDGVNLWWSIAGVEEDSGMVLYPETFGRYIPFKSQSGYIPPGNTLPKPQKLDIPDGSIFVFNSDLLHGSHLNISRVTRIAIAPRVCLDRPRFNPDARHFDVDGWYSSEDIAGGNFENLITFPRQANGGILYEHRQKPHAERRISITLNSDLVAGRAVRLCPSDTLPVGEKMLVSFPQEDIVIIRSTRGLRALGATCPHLNVNLIDGFHDDQHIYCPGHGVAFSLGDGSSKCSLLNVQVYRAYDHDDHIVVESAMNPVASSGTRCPS